MLRHAQEMEPDVVDQHIDLYVNEFTDRLGEEGLHAVRTLLDRSAELSLMPRVRADALDATRRLVSGAPREQPQRACPLQDLPQR